MTRTVRNIALNATISTVVAIATVLLLRFTMGFYTGPSGLPLTISAHGVVFASSFSGKSATEKLDRAIQACGDQRCFVIITPDIGLGAPSNIPDNVTLIDLRQESVRILRRGFPLSDGSPQTFANEPNNSTLVVADSVPADVDHEQDQAIAGLIDSPNLNAVGIWGGARSMAMGARVWGGFFNVSNEESREDAQLIALEVDTLNYGLPGVHPNHSKVGVQIVGLGDALNTNAIEIRSNERGRWVNGIVIEPDSLAPDGTVLGVGGKGPYALGINFGDVAFTDAAIRMGPGQKIRMDGPTGNASILYRDADAPDQLVLQVGTGGLRIMDNTGMRVLLQVLPDGTLQVAGKIISQGKDVEQCGDH